MEEIETLNRLRNRVLYEGYKNSLVEWTLHNWSDGNWGNPDIRGTVRDGNLNHGPLQTARNGDTISGEITCHGCSCGK